VVKQAGFTQILIYFTCDTKGILENGKNQPFFIFGVFLAALMSKVRPELEFLFKNQDPVISFDFSLILEKQYVNATPQWNEKQHPIRTPALALLGNQTKLCD
jgi:hypothetical protein